MYADFTSNDGYIFDADLLVLRRTIEAFEAMGESNNSPFIRMARQLLDHVDATNPYAVSAQAWDEGYDVGRNDGWHDARDPEPNPYRDPQ